MINYTDIDNHILSLPIFGCVIISIAPLNIDHMSLISGLIKNLRALIGQSNTQASPTKQDKFSQESNVQEVYVPIRYEPTRRDKTKSQEAR